MSSTGLLLGGFPQRGSSECWIFFVQYAGRRPRVGITSHRACPPCVIEPTYLISRRDQTDDIGFRPRGVVPVVQGRNNLIPMSGEKLLPSRFAASLWYWLDTMALENVRNCGTSNDVTEIR